MAEKAFRRGFQQGFCLAKGIGIFKYIPTESEINDWRFWKDMTECIPPPGHYEGTNSLRTAQQRYDAEMPSELKCLLNPER
jgi:hypothetical protein